MITINDVRTVFSFQELLAAAETGKFLPDLIYVERYSNSMYEMLTSFGKSNETYGILWNRPRYIHVDFVKRYVHTNIALAIDHLKNTITGFAAQWLFARIHPEIKEISPVGLSLNRDKKDINKSDFEAPDGSNIEFKYCNPKSILDKLNEDDNGWFYKTICHNAIEIYCWYEDSIYRIAKKDSKWVITDTEHVAEQYLSDMRKLRFILNNLDPDEIYARDPEFFDDLPDMSKAERTRIR